MLKHVLRGAAVTVGAALVLGGVAAPAAAEEIVPEGCAGTVFYACTGDAQPPNQFNRWVREHYDIPVTLTAPGTRLVPGQTVGGQEVGGVVVLTPGQSIPGQTVETGPISPYDTGVRMPIQICAFLTCIPAGAPITTPGVPLPVIPVTIPDVIVPSQSIDVPVVATIPVQSTPPLETQTVKVEVTTIRVYEVSEDEYALGHLVCGLGGGDVYYVYEGGNPRTYCAGTLAPIANLFFDRVWHGQP